MSQEPVPSAVTKNSPWPVLTGRLVMLALALALVVMIVPVGIPWAFLLVNSTLLVVVLIDWLLAPKPSSVGVERELPPLLTLDGEGTLTWAVRNPTGRRLYFALADDLAPSLSAARRRISGSLLPHGRVLFDATLRPTRRGRFDVDEIVVRVEGPLRLAARQGRRSMHQVLRVYPPFRSKREAELRIERARILEVGLRSVQGHAGGTEFEQLREYGVDDDYRRIDWAATARAGKGIVRTYRAEQNQNVILLLDCGRVMSGRVGGVPRLEHAMDAVMTLTTVASRLGDRVGLVAFDRSVRAEVPAGHGPRQLAKVTEAMYQLEPRLVESDYRGGFVHTLSRFRRRSLVVVLTELAEQGLADTLLPALPLIQRHHLVLVAGVNDPDISEWAQAVPTETSSAYRKAAAVSASNARRKTITLLRHRGATVVDAVPGKLSVSLADAYLNVKATGRL